MAARAKQLNLGIVLTQTGTARVCKSEVIISTLEQGDCQEELYMASVLPALHLRCAFVLVDCQSPWALQDLRIGAEALDSHLHSEHDAALGWGQSCPVQPKFANSNYSLEQGSYGPRRVHECPAERRWPLLCRLVD